MGTLCTKTSHRCNEFNKYKLVPIFLLAGGAGGDGKAGFLPVS